MKKHTHILIATMIALGASAFLAAKNKPTPPTHTVPVNPVWFSTIQIAEGITVEFEYGPRLQVFVEGGKELSTQVALVLENNVLTAHDTPPLSGGILVYARRYTLSCAGSHHAECAAWHRYTCFTNS